MAERESIGKVVNISQFIRDWHAVLDQTENQKTDNVTFDEYLKMHVDIDDAMVTELDTVCG